MCSIAGQVSFNGLTEADKQTINKMNSALRHRGRDGAGVFFSKDVGLAHNRLAIIDLTESASQPMSDVEHEIFLTFNGEIFNYLELRSELINRGHVFRTSSDTEVLLLAYKEYGFSLFEKIDGMYAFAIFDKTKNITMLARDPLGIKPLYFARNGQSILFASEIKAIVTSGACQSKLDVFGLDDYLSTQLYTEGRTLFKNIEALKPGHFLVIDSSRKTLEERRYWSPPTEELDIGYDECQQQLHDIVKDAVYKWSRADVGIASYLSGGLDSSIVSRFAALSLRESNQALTTISSIFPGQNFQDESALSEEMATFLKSSHRPIVLDSGQIIESHRTLIYSLDMPIAGFSAPYFVLSRYARSHAKVVLTGHGGDELFGGYPKYIIANLIKEISDGYKNSSSSESNFNSLKFIHGFSAQAKSMIDRAAFGAPDDIIRAFFGRSEHFKKYLNPEILREIGDYSYVQVLRESLNNGDRSFLKNLPNLDQSFLLPGLLHVEDRVSMAANLESRSPLLSKHVIDFAARIPSKYLIKDGLKSILRSSFKEDLPNSIVHNQRKSGVVFPVFELLDKGLKEEMLPDLEILDNTGLFTAPAADLLNFKRDLINQRDLWALWSLASWLKTYRPSIV